MGPIVFDAYGTVFDIASAVRRHAVRIGAEAERLNEIWRTKQLEYAFVRTLAGAPYRDFETLTAQALDTALACCPSAPSTVRGDLMAAYRRLEAYPEVPAVLSRLRERCHALAILSNGSPAMLEEAVASAGLSKTFDAVLSIEAVGRFKTAPEAYALVGERFDRTNADVTFVSSNRWDIAGAKVAGFMTVWVNRTGAPDEYPDLPPARVVSSLADLLTAP